MKAGTDVSRMGLLCSRPVVDIGSCPVCRVVGNPNEVVGILSVGRGK